MLISETFVNLDKGYRFGESEPYEPYTDNVGELFREMRREYGRCTGSVYVDTTDGKVKRIGWVFQKRMEYEDYRRGDSERYYTREVWVTLHDAKDTVTRQAHFHEI